VLGEITQVVALITVLGTAIYIIGLIALCWPIYRLLTHDASTGLYAAALVPRTVVAGQGIRIFVGFPLVAALCLLIVVSMALWHRVMARWERDILEWFFASPPNSANVLHQILVGFVATLIALSFILSVKKLLTKGLFDFFFTPINEPDASPFTLFSIVLSATGGAIGGWIILTADPVNWQTLLLALVFFFGAIVIGGVPDAVSIDPPLPKVTVTQMTKTGEKHYEGKLLTHSDGHWYVFEKTGDQEHVLHMIPDDKAEVACLQAK
jgi:hypothetical protein